MGMKYAMESRNIDQRDEELRLKSDELRQKNVDSLLKHRAEMAKIKNQNKTKKESL